MRIDCIPKAAAQYASAIPHNCTCLRFQAEESTNHSRHCLSVLNMPVENTICLLEHRVIQILHSGPPDKGSFMSNTYCTNHNEFLRTIDIIYDRMGCVLMILPFTSSDGCARPCHTLFARIYCWMLIQSHTLCVPFRILLLLCTFPKVSIPVTNTCPIQSVCYIIYLISKLYHEFIFDQEHWTEACAYIEAWQLKKQHLDKAERAERVVPAVVKRLSGRGRLGRYFTSCAWSSISRGFQTFLSSSWNHAHLYEQLNK